MLILIAVSSLTLVDLGVRELNISSVTNLRLIELYFQLPVKSHPDYLDSLSITPGDIDLWKSTSDGSFYLAIIRE